MKHLRGDEVSGVTQACDTGHITMDFDGTSASAQGPCSPQGTDTQEAVRPARLLCFSISQRPLCSSYSSDASFYFKKQFLVSESDSWKRKVLS